MSSIKLAEGFVLPSEMTNERITLFCRLHQFETWFRELVYVETKSWYGPTWWTECQAALKRNKGGGIPPERALRHDSKHPHMATPENDPLWFISFDSLLKILFDKKLWKLFEPYLTTKQLVRAKFMELMPVRHRIAHCRAIHQDDLARVENVMRDLDQGFWKFCTSYNDESSFHGKKEKDDVAHYFRHEYNVESSTGIHIDFMVRAAARYPKGSSVAGKKSALYNVVFVIQHPRRFKSAETLRATRQRHASVVHIILDAPENLLRITLPAILGAAEIIDVIKQFHDVCQNSITSIPHPLSVPAAREEKEDPHKWYSEHVAPMKLLASQWPHYVLSPDNPLAYLNPECPCSFFSV